VIKEFDRLAGNAEFGWGLLVGIAVAVVVLTVAVLVWRRQYRAGIATVAVAVGLSVLAVSGDRDEVERRLRDPSFRWGLLGGVLLAAVLATWVVLLSRRRWVLAGALAGLAALFVLVVGYRSGIDDLLRSDSFRRALFAGALVVAVLVVAALGARSRPWRVGAVGVVIATFVALTFARLHPRAETRLLASMIALALAGIVADRSHWRLPVRVLALVPGAVLLGSTIGATASSERALLAAVVVLSAGAAVGTPRLAVGCTEPVILAITFAGVYVCVPETAIAVVVFGAAVPFGVAGWPIRALENGAALPAIAGLVVWLAFIEGQARDGAVVGAIACLGVLLLQPVLTWMRNPPPAGAIVLVHGLLVMWCARVAGLRHGAFAALLIAALGAAVAVCALQVVPWRTWGDELRSIIRPDGDGS
jgi:hypothetical protein